MNLLMIIRVAFRALQRNKMRAALTMLGIIIGVSAVVAMVSIGQGAQAAVQAQIDSIGTNLLFVSAGGHLPRQTVATDPAGRFRVTVASGGWLVYVQGEDGKPIFQHKIEVLDNQTRQLNLVNS